MPSTSAKNLPSPTQVQREEEEREAGIVERGDDRELGGWSGLEIAFASPVARRTSRSRSPRASPRKRRPVQQAVDEKIPRRAVPDPRQGERDEIADDGHRR